MKKLLLLIVALYNYNAQCQQKLDGVININGEPKKYSIYVPKNFTPNKTNAILAFHPLNTARWNAVTWRDTLTQFAELNNVLLICPDGGADGRVNDDIDTILATELLKSISSFFPYNSNNNVAMGFSVGGLTTYTYGLTHASQFIGFIPIGAAINGTIEFENLVSNAKDKSFYIIHGSNDDMNNRFTPAKKLLQNSKACVRDSVLTGIGHTIDFPNRNAILSHAYQSILKDKCLISDTKQVESSFHINHISYKTILISDNSISATYQLISGNGIYIKDLHSGVNELLDINSGIYLIKIITSQKEIFSKKIFLD